MKPSRAQLVVLSLLHESPRQISRTELVKWVFLLAQETQCSSVPGMYEFVPYRYGPFSFSLYRDLHKLQSQGCIAFKQLALTPHGESVLAQNLKLMLGDIHVDLLRVVGRVSRLAGPDLLRHVYEHYPYYARNSELTDRYRSRMTEAPAVYTCGYQGHSLESFLNKMIATGIERIVDVRNNACSRKYGFSGRTLAKTCPRVSLLYEHVPDLGIPGELRRELSTQGDYDRLFDDYEAGLPAKESLVDHVAGTMSQSPSVLICYEAEPEQCHRSRLADKVAQKNGLDIVHL